MTLVGDENSIPRLRYGELLGILPMVTMCACAFCLGRSETGTFHQAFDSTDRLRSQEIVKAGSSSYSVF